MDTVRAMRFFVRMVELGSLTSVAREFGTTQPTVSKVLALLEAQLGVRLFERSTRGLAQTAQGQRFYREACAILEHFDAAVGEVQGLSGQATGLLRISAPVALGQYRINALIQEFMRLHPAIDIELTLDDRFANLVEDGVDVALRLGAALPPDVVARHLADVPRFFVAAGAYLARRGVPTQPAQLAQHEFVRFAWPSGDMVDLYRGAERVRIAVRCRYRVNNALAIREAVSLGGGIGLCPEWLVHDLLASGELVRVLPGWSAQTQHLHVLYPSRRYQPLRAKLFIEFIAGRFAELPGFGSPRS